MLINGMTVEWFFKKIELINESVAHKKWVALANTELLYFTIEEFNKCQKQHSKRFANWTDVKKLVGIDFKTQEAMIKTGNLIAKIVKDCKVDSNEAIDKVHSKMMNEDEALQQLRLKTLNLIIKNTNENKEDYICPPDVYNIIDRCVFMAKREINKPIELSKMNFF